MNILIVDDNANNRMILRLLLEDYSDDNSVEFNIDEASDGLEAVDKCKNSFFDIILMDIMMPNMDGIKATKIIRDDNPDIMIIAVSAVDDSERQKKILSNGAEDYISKPINADIFVSRLKNYIKLVHHRHHTKNTSKNNKESINIFTNKIYSKHTNFIINSEDSLSEFWEFFLLNSKEKYDNLSDVVRTVFYFAEIMMSKLNLDVVISVEESETHQYFTLNQLDKLPSKVIELVMYKSKVSCEYKIEESKISFELLKHITLSDDIEPLVEDNKPKEENTTSVVDYSDVSIDDTLSSKELEVFRDYIFEEDLVDLEEYASKLSSMLLLVSNGGISDEEIEEIYSYLEKIGSVLTSYTEIYPISQALTMLSFEMANHKDVFKENSEALGPMCKAFSKDMSSWINKSFHTGAPSIDFMNDTIVVNCETIASMLKMNDDVSADSAGDDLDDIFDF